MTDKVKELAEGLSEAQRGVLLNAWEYPDYHRTGPQFSLCAVTVNPQNDAAMNRKGLVASKAHGGPRITNLGLAVRQYLKDNQDG